MSTFSDEELNDAVTLLQNYSGSDQHLILCTASAWTGAKRQCRWCDAALTGRKLRWCSNECANQYGNNHWWSAASEEAKKRDGYVCVECGKAGTDHGIGKRGLQVHHLSPILGRHGVSGCHHHLDGLVTLCKAHHLEAHRILAAKGQLELGDAR